jgi:dihydrolipoamide dehydrogenase
VEKMDYDVAVIGGGPGGYVAAIKAAQLGGRVALFEKEKLGGTCLNWGCIPTKCLLKTAGLLAEIQEAEVYGISGVDKDALRIDYPRLAARKDALTGSLRVGIEDLVKRNRVDLYREQAFLRHPGEIRTNAGMSLRCRSMILATGSEAMIPPIPGLEDAIRAGFAITNREALDMVKLPPSMGIIGGGVIGVELALAYSAMGVSVHIYEAMDSILPPIDKDLSAIIHRRMVKSGVRIHTSSRVTRVQSGAVEFLEDGREMKDLLDLVIVAVGRSPNIKSLLDLGVADGKKVPVNRNLETRVPNVYAVGDCNGSYQLAHVASAEGSCAAKNALGQRQAMSYESVPICIYTLPEIACIGITEEKARIDGIPCKVGKFPLSFNAKSRIENETSGFIKILVSEKYGNILGVHMIGHHVSEMIFGLGVAIQAELTIDDITDVIFPHPSISESILEASMAVLGKPIHS